MQWYFYAGIAALSGLFGGLLAYLVLNWNTLRQMHLMANAVWGAQGRAARKDQSIGDQAELAMALNEFAELTKNGASQQEAMMEVAKAHPALAVSLAKRFGVKI